MNLLEQAKEAVRKSRDLAPADGRRFNGSEVEELNRLCKGAYLVCKAAGVTISQMRLELWREECEAYRASLKALCQRRAA